MGLGGQEEEEELKWQGVKSVEVGWGTRRNGAEVRRTDQREGEVLAGPGAGPSAPERGHKLMY